MKYWTFQRKGEGSPVQQLADNIPVIPDWLTKDGPIAGCSVDAYRYLLQQFREKCCPHATGLIFGYAGYQTVDELYQSIDSIGEPGGSVFPPETHALLELEVSDGIPMMTVDFYRFSDLLFAFSEGDEAGLPLSVAKDDLFKPNGADAMELPVTHIHEIRPEWVVNIHTPKSL